MTRVFVSLGSNIEPEQHIRRAISALRETFGGLRVSSVYRSAAVGFEGRDFLNLVVGFDTDRPVEAIALALRQIESLLGRVRGGPRFSSRTIDLDLLAYGDQVIERGPLRLPRDEITRYAFVLRPLAEIAGERVHPVLGRPYSLLAEELDVEPKDIEMIGSFRV